MSAAVEDYQKCQHLDHILLRPDTYVGSTVLRIMDQYIADEKNKIKIKSVRASNALLRIFVEVLQNCIDNAFRSKSTNTPCTSIKINISSTTGETKVWNDGVSIPVERNDEGNYIHSMIFGELLTSSNFSTDKERIGSGRNGYGSNLCNIFSSHFQVRGYDPERKKLFSQVWRNNMKESEEPVVEDCKRVKGFTEVIYYPDFSRFSLNGYTKSIIGMYRFYCLGAAAVSRVPIYFNGEILPVRSLLDYAFLIRDSEKREEEKKAENSPSDEKREEKEEKREDDYLLIRSGNSEVVLIPSEGGGGGRGGYQTFSFANGIYTKSGGTHVDAWSEAIFREVLEKINKKSSKKLNITDVKQYFKLFVNVSVVNPVFDGQDKSMLEAPEVEAKVSTANVTKVMKWSVIERLREIVRLREVAGMKKSERKRGEIYRVEGFDPANKEGGKNSTDCILIICEGLSAKTFAVYGINQGLDGKHGRDYIGILPVRGKILNVQTSSVDKLSKNAIITNLIKILGVKLGVDYTDDAEYQKLRYGKILVLTDQDEDGFHICGLLQNFLYILYPSLKRRAESFITVMQTPIVRVFSPDRRIFYDERQFMEYLRTVDEGKIKKKYFKGLGASGEKEIKDVWAKKMLDLVDDEESDSSMRMVFGKATEQKKDWVVNYDPTNFSGVVQWNTDNTVEHRRISISNYLNNIVVQHSVKNCKRCIPTLVDGLKEGMKKILYTAIKKGLKYTGKIVKVAQFGPAVAELTHYRHGEKSLEETIVGMAQHFVGANNISLLDSGDSMFGTRINGGKDAAASRYIFTRMDELTRLIFRPEDDNLLTYLYDDGDRIEPEFFVPIVPMVLINGAQGIGTAWSTYIPQYNPLDIVAVVKLWLSSDGYVMETDEDGNTSSILPHLIPWYRGHTGEMEVVEEGKYKSWGVVEGGEGYKIVSELPVKEWTDPFKTKLDDLLVKKKIMKYDNYSTPKKVRFHVYENKAGEERGRWKCNENSLKLHSTISTTNMVLFDEKGVLRKYETIDEIVDEFCKVRMKYYILRKEHLISEVLRKLVLLRNKKRFLVDVIEEKIYLFAGKRSKSEEEWTKELDTAGYDQIEGSYSYLYEMKIRNFTENKVRSLSDDIVQLEDEYEELKSTTPKQMWLNDLNEFVIAYEAYFEKLQKEDEDDAIKGVGGKRGKGGKGRRGGRGGRGRK